MQWPAPLLQSTGAAVGQACLLTAVYGTEECSMANGFILTQDDNFNWQGLTGTKVTLKVVAVNSTVPISILDAYHPGTTALEPTGDTVAVILVAGQADVSLSIKPRAVPPIIWALVEVGPGGDQQTLATVNDPEPYMDPYGTSVQVSGVAA